MSGQAGTERDGRGGLRRAAQVMAGLARALGLAGAVLAAAVLAAMVAIVFASILARNLGTGAGLDYAAELAGYGVAAMTYGALAHALRTDALIRVSLASELVRRHPRLDRLLHGLALVLTLLAIGLAARHLWSSVLRQWHRGSVSSTTAEVPLWLPEAVMLAGLALFLLQLLALLANLLVGNHAAAGSTLGSAGTGAPALPAGRE